jgi:hypothetical protein
LQAGFPVGRTNSTVDTQAVKASQQFQTACIVTFLFGGFRLLYALVLPGIVGSPPPMAEIVHGLLFLILGLLLSRRKWWCLWIVLLFSILTIGYQFALLLTDRSSGLIFLLVLGTIVFIANAKVLHARRFLTPTDSI